MNFPMLNFEYKILKTEGNYVLLKINNNYSALQGFSITIGNALRRVLLNNLMGAAVVSFTVERPKNDSTFIQSVKEDIFEIKNNIKKIVLRTSKIGLFNINLNIQGPALITAGDLMVPKSVFIVNPTQHLFTIVNDEIFNLSLKVEQGFGYKFYNENYNMRYDTNNVNTIDANFSPVIKVNYKVIMEESEIFPNKMIESLLLEIWTNGSITPIRAFMEANKILSSAFVSLIR